MSRIVDYPKRLAKLRKAMKKANFPAILVSSRENINYLSGFRGSAGMLLIAADDKPFKKNDAQVLFSDFRYRIQAKEQAPDYKFCLISGGMAASVAMMAKAMKLNQIGIEAHNLTVMQMDAFKEGFPEAEWKSAGSIIESLREIKDASELTDMQLAAKITDGALAHMLSLVKPGVTERELAVAGEFYMQDAGAKDVAFDIIVGSGPRSALPHAESGARKLKHGDLIVFDLGAKTPNGYCADLTRTVVVGKAKAWQKKIYNLVYEAQARALKKLKPGVIMGKVDAAARDFLTRNGHGKDFGHGLGHGVGLAVHEAPGLGSGSKAILKPRMVVTVEPGIYLEGRGGVRIEDLAVITQTGYRLLSNAPKPKELPEI